MRTTPPIPMTEVEIAAVQEPGGTASIVRSVVADSAPSAAGTVNWSFALRDPGP